MKMTLILKQWLRGVAVFLALRGIFWFRPTSSSFLQVVRDEGGTGGHQSESDVTMNGVNATSLQSQQQQPPQLPHSPSPLSIAALEDILHARRYEQLRQAPVDDMLVWLVSNSTNRTRGYALLEPFYQNDDLFRVDNKVTDADSLPTHRQYKIVYASGRDTGICQVAKLFAKYRLQHNSTPYPHVLLFSFHEDYGGMKDGMTAKWRRFGQCKPQFVMDYMNHPDTLGAFTFQYHYTNHPKIHSVALGYRFEKHGRQIYQALRQFPPSLFRRTKAIMFNNNMGHQGGRKVVLQQLQDNFAHTNITIKNTFSKKNLTKYYEELATSKFVASPKGLGRDCYRNYEALFMGCIPIIATEGRNDGWYRTFDDLPVAFVEDYRHVTPRYIETEYRRLLERGATYNWHKLTKSWWIHHIYSLFDEYYQQRGMVDPAKAKAAKAKKGKPRGKTKKTKKQ